MKFFNVDNPVWRFVGNLADFFVLSVLWAVCCLPVVTIGASTTALYYVTMKMARNREGELIPSFFASFRQNLRQGIALWVGYLAVGLLIGLNYLHYHSERIAGVRGNVHHLCGAGPSVGTDRNHAVSAAGPVREYGAGPIQDGGGYHRAQHSGGGGSLITKLGLCGSGLCFCSGRCCCWRRGCLLLQLLPVQSDPVQIRI